MKVKRRIPQVFSQGDQPPTFINKDDQIKLLSRNLKQLYSLLEIFYNNTQEFHQIKSNKNNLFPYYL